MMFNVEDLLALPQLKQGKLPKSIKEIKVKDSIDEVSAIMDFKLKIKNINFDVKYIGFGEEGKEDYSVFFD